MKDIFKELGGLFNPNKDKFFLVSEEPISTPKKVLSAQELLDELIAIKDQYGNLDVPINIFIQDSERLEISNLDAFTTGRRGELYSIDINILSDDEL